MRLRGIQMGFGSMRGDAELLDAGDPVLSDFLDRMLDHVITEDDFANVKSMGANSVRLSLSTYKDFEDDSKPYTYRENNFRKLDEVVDWAEKHEVYLVISMRQSPGGHNSSAHSGNDGKGELWRNREYRKRLAALWEKIAGRYADRPIVAGYDVLNEPLAPDRASFNEVLDEVTHAIRKAGSQQIVFLEGNEWANKLDWINSPTDKNTVLSNHFYEPGIYTTDGEGTYPSVIRGMEFNKDSLEKALTREIEYAIELDRPVWVGEFGARASADNYLAYDKDLLQVLEELGLNWCYYDYKNIKGLKGTWSIYYSAPDHPIAQLVQELDEKPLSSLTENEINQALESLETHNFHERTKLKDLLIRYL